LIEKYKKERRESELENGKTRKPSTINRELQILSKIFSLAIRYGVTDKNPCAEVSLLPDNNKRVRYLFDEEEQRLLSVLTGARGHLLPLVILAIGTGMRRGDLFNLDLRHTFGPRLAEAGYSEATIADMMGHSDPQTAALYTCDR